MANAKRRQKKLAKRGRIATPRLPESPLIKGVPGMQDGGFWGGWQPPNISASSPYGDPAHADLLRQISDFANIWGVDSQTAAMLMGQLQGDYLTSGQLERMLTGGAGGGGAAWLPGEYDLEVRKLDLATGQQWLDAQRANLDREADIAIANQNTQAQIDIANQRAELDIYQANLQAEQQNLDRIIAQQQVNQDTRGQDITMRGQDIQAQLTNIDQQIRADEIARQDAIATGNLQLQQQIEARMAQNAQTQAQLQQRAQDIDVQGLSVQAQIAQGQQAADFYRTQAQMFATQGDFAAAANAEQRMRAQMQQNALLDTYASQVQGYQGGISGLGQAATALGNLYGNVADATTARRRDLTQLAANPRDFMQLQFNLGGGESFINQLLSGNPMTGQTALSGSSVPTLGPGWEELARQAMLQPEQAILDPALAMAQRLGEFATSNMPAAPDLERILAYGENLPPLYTPGPAPSAPNPMQVTINQPAPVNIPPPPAPVAAKTYTFADFWGYGPGQSTNVAQVQAMVDAANAGQAIPQARPAISTTYTPPAPIAQPGPTSILNPVQATTYNDFLAAAPETPEHVAATVAIDPDRAITYMNTPTAPAPAPSTPQYTDAELAYMKAISANTALETQKQLGGATDYETLRKIAGYKGGGDVMITDEPIVGMGMMSGQPKFTVHDKFTAAQPMGEPEMLEGIAGGMRVTPMSKVPGFATGGAVGGGFPQLGGLNIMQYLQQQNRPTPYLTGPTGIPGGAYGTGNSPGLLQRAGVGWRSPNFGQVGYGGGGQSPYALARQAQRPQRPVGWGGFADGGSVLTPGAAVRRLWNQTPQQFYSLLPSQRGLMDSITSAFGVDPADALASKLASFPTAPQGNRWTAAGF